MFSFAGICIYGGAKTWIHGWRYALISGSQNLDDYESEIVCDDRYCKAYMNSRSNGQRYQVHRGYEIDGIISQPFTGFFGKEKFYERYDFLTKKWKSRKDDIWVSTFAKCGTTWTEQIIMLLLHCDGDPSKLPPNSQNSYIPGTKTPGKVWALHDIAIDNGGGETKHKHKLKILTLNEFESLPFRRIMKSHCVYNQFPGLDDGKIAEGVKVVLTARNCFDACVSLYHFHDKFQNGVPFDAFARAYAEGVVEDGCWFNWYKQWGKQQALQPDHILIVYFEDLKKDPGAQVRRIADFLGVEYSEALVDRVIAGSSFKTMKSRSENPDKFFRGGRIGDNKKYFSPEMKRAFTELLCQSGLGDFPLRYKEDLLSIISNSQSV